MHPEFDSLTTTAGLEIVDPIESRRFALRTSTPVTPTPAPTAEFAFPVDTACEIRTDELTLPYALPVTVREPDATHLRSLRPPERAAFGDGSYLVEVDAPIKVYVRVDGPFAVEGDADGVTVEFGTATTLRVGARSYHSSPADAITVPDDPAALMEAVSAFSSALKTTSCERSWPTLRGHPPRLERGDELAIPDGLRPPDTGIAVEIPAEYGAVFGVAPLAYYLGADVVPGSTPRVRTDDGSAHELGEGVAEIAANAGELLKRVLVLDVVTRTEGYYPVTLHERELLESRVDIDFEAVYEADPADRLAAYLSIPDDAVDAVKPTWHRVTHVGPDPTAIELLPYVVDDLSVVRVRPPGDSEWTPTQSQRTTESALQSFVRGPGPGDEGRAVPSPNPPDVRSRPRSDTDDLPDGSDERGVPGVGEYVPLPDVDALEQAYVGDRTPENGAKLLPSAFENDAPELTDGVIDITVVCNDDRMREEWDSVSDIYDARDDVYVDVTCRFDASTDALRDLLAADHDVFHFIGHIDGLGFQCHDGVLDAGTVETTGATTVLLNGCRSHDQGVELVEAGANAAVASLGDVGNRGAVEVGETLARLLQHGFSVGSAMDIVRDHTLIGRDYVVLGDPNVEVAQCETALPVVHYVSETGQDGETVEVETLIYATRINKIGALFTSFLPGTDARFVGVGFTEPVELPVAEFRRVLRGNSEPLVVDGDLTWSDEWFGGG